MSGGKPIQEGVRIKLPAGMTWEKLAQMTPDEIKSQWDETRDTSAKSGTAMHANIESYLNSLPVCDESDEFKMFLKFWGDFQAKYSFKPYRLEWCVYDELFRNGKGLLFDGYFLRFPESSTRQIIKSFLCALSDSVVFSLSLCSPGLYPGSAPVSYPDQPPRRGRRVAFPHCE